MSAPPCQCCSRHQNPDVNKSHVDTSWSMALHVYLIPPQHVLVNDPACEYQHLCVPTAGEPPHRSHSAEDCQGSFWWEGEVCGVWGCSSGPLCGGLPQHHPLLPSPAGVCLSTCLQHRPFPFSVCTCAVPPVGQKLSAVQPRSHSLCNSVLVTCWSHAAHMLLLITSSLDCQVSSRVCNNPG